MQFCKLIKVNKSAAEGDFRQPFKKGYSNQRFVNFKNLRFL